MLKYYKISFPFKLEFKDIQNKFDYYSKHESYSSSERKSKVEFEVNAIRIIEKGYINLIRILFPKKRPKWTDKELFCAVFFVCYKTDSNGERRKISDLMLIDGSTSAFLVDYYQELDKRGLFNQIQTSIDVTTTKKEDIKKVKCNEIEENEYKEILDLIEKRDMNKLKAMSILLE